MLRRTLLATVVVALAHPLPRASGAATAATYYDPMELHTMIAAAKLVVVGTIASVDADVFHLDIEEVLAGETGLADGERLEVVRFVDWPCAQRWKPYAPGQRVLLLLWRHDVDQDGRPVPSWRILSGGGEGEMPVFTGPVAERGVPPRALVVLRGDEVPDHKEIALPDGSKLDGWVQDLDAVIADVREWRTSFRTTVLLDRSSIPKRIETRRTRDELLAMQKSQDQLMAHLARKLAPLVVHVTGELEPGPK